MAGIWSNLVNSFSTTGTPIYTMERDNSVANAYNSWLQQENAKMAQAEQAARQAELQSQAQVNQMSMNQLMNEFNMNKYAEAEENKIMEERSRYYVDAYSKLGDKLNSINNQLAGKLDSVQKSMLEGQKEAIVEQMAAIRSFMPEGMAEALDLSIAVSEKGLDSAKKQKKKESNALVAKINNGEALTTAERKQAKGMGYEWDSNVKKYVKKDGK